MCCLTVVVVLAVLAVCINYVNGADKVQYEENAPVFSGREVTIISDETSGSSIKLGLRENTDSLNIKNTLDDQSGSIIVLDGNWLSAQNNENLSAEFSHLLLSGKPVIILPDSAGILYAQLVEIGKSVNFMVYDESSPIFGFAYLPETGNVYSYSGINYPEPLEALPDAYLWAEHVLSGVYFEMSGLEKPSYVDAKTIVCEPYGKVRMNTVYVDLNEDRVLHHDGYHLGYEVLMFIETVPNSSEGYRAADVQIYNDLGALNPESTISYYFPMNSGTVTAPMFSQNSTVSMNTKKIPIYDHSQLGMTLDLTFDLDERDVMGANNVTTLATECVNIMDSIYNLDINVNVTFCHMNYGLLNFEQYGNYHTFEFKSTGCIGDLADL